MCYKKAIWLCLTTIFFFLVGCNGQKLYYQTETNVADVVQRVQDARHMSNQSGKPQPAMVVNSGLYVDKTPISLAKRPAWLKNQIVIRGDNLPFSYYARTIVGGGGNILTRYQNGLDETVKVSMNYSGPLKGALDLLASKAGLVYSINGKNIYWQAYVTRTFDIAFMPGAVDYQMGKAAGTTGTVSANAGSQGGQTVNAVVDDSSSSMYSNLKGQLSVWTDLQDSIKQLLSPDGKVMVSESTTSVTVRDRPTNVELVSKFVNNFNHNLSKQVLIKVQVLDISLSNAFNFGIDWTLVKKTLGSDFIFNGNYSTPISVSNLAPFAATTPFPGTGTQPGLPQLGVFNPGMATGVTAIINALNQQGKVSVVTEPRVVCLNNQVGVIRILNQQGYLASVQNTTVAGVAGGGSAGTITSQITPGTVVTGLTLYILPKIMSKKVYLQVNADLSSLVSIVQVSSGSTTNTNAPVIQVPNLTQKQFNQRSVIGSGDTMILSGFRAVSNTANAMQAFDSQALGGQASTQNNIETIVLITPIIL